MWRGLVSLVALGACASASAQVEPLPMALCAGWENERVCEVLQEDAQIRVLRCTFPPGFQHTIAQLFKAAFLAFAKI